MQLTRKGASVTVALQGASRGLQGDYEFQMAVCVSLFRNFLGHHLRSHSHGGKLSSEHSSGWEGSIGQPPTLQFLVFRERTFLERLHLHEKGGRDHEEVSLNYCSQNGGNVYKAPYYSRNLHIGPRIDSNLGQSP